MRLHILLALACLFCLPIASCKKQDGTPPSVELLAPADFSSFVASYPVAVQFNASDETALGNATVTIVDDLFGRTVSTGSLTLDRAEETRSISLNLGDRYTEAGTYTLTVTVQDKAGNTSKAAVQLQVSELPQRFYRTIFTVYPPQVGVYQLFSIDSAGLSDAGPYLGDSVADLLVENRNQLVAVALRDDGTVRGYRPEDFQPDFVDQPFPLQRGINCLRSAGKEGYLIGYESPPYLRQLDRNGLWKNDWDGLLFPVRNALYDGNRVFLAVHGVLGQPIKLDQYNYPGENLTSARPLNWDARYLARHEDALIAAGPFGSQTKVFRLSLPSLVPTDSVTLNSPFITADGAGDHYFVLTEMGVARVDLPNFNLNANFLTGSFSGMGYEPSKKQLWLGGSGVLDVYALNGSLVASHVTSAGDVTHIGFQLNK
jgi:hypothetical protein